MCSSDLPAVLGRESAYRSERQSALDYIEVASPEEAVAAVEMLQGDRNLRRAMIENGRIRAQETGNAQIVGQWRHFLTKVAVPAYYRWCTASIWQQQIFLTRRYLTMKANRLHQFVSEK